jgi:Ca2+/Na+ antiporter
MLNNLYSELEIRQERMHRKSKEKFRGYLKDKADELKLGYKVTPNNSSIAKNVIIGSLQGAKYVIGAHYDTPPRMPALLMKSTVLLNLFLMAYAIVMFIFTIINPFVFLIMFLLYITMLLYMLGFFSIANKYNYNDNTSGVLTVLYLMEKLKDEACCFVFFDNEEKGLLGSLVFRKMYARKLNNKEIIILDCVGMGSHFGLISYGRSKLSNILEDKAKGFNNGFSFVARKPSSFEMSDHASFRNFEHVGIMCYHKKDNKYRMKNIHSHKDKYLDLDNIEAISKLIIKHINNDKLEENNEQYI